MRLLIVFGSSQNYQNVAESNKLMDDGWGRGQYRGMNSTLYIPQSYGCLNRKCHPIED
jgi:hypothetical protein